MCNTIWAVIICKLEMSFLSISLTIHGNIKTHNHHDYIQDYNDIEGTRLSFKISHTRTDLTA